MRCAADGLDVAMNTSSTFEDPFLSYLRRSILYTSDYFSLLVGFRIAVDEWILRCVLDAGAFDAFFDFGLVFTLFF